jgi:hypothetical protein
MVIEKFFKDVGGIVGHLLVHLNQFVATELNSKLINSTRNSGSNNSRMNRIIAAPMQCPPINSNRYENLPFATVSTPINQDVFEES